MATNSEIDLIEALLDDILDSVKDKPRDISGVALLAASATLFHQDNRGDMRKFLDIAASCFTAAKLRRR